MRLIDADKLFICALPYFTDPTEDNFEMFDVVRVEDIKNAPTIDPVKQGHWVDSSNGWCCNNCNYETSRPSNFCPNCGVDMRVKLVLDS